MKRFVMLGAPGAGKGTQAAAICEQLNLSHFCTGDLLRAAISNQSDVGKAAKVLMDQGRLVPDQVVIDIISEAIKTSNPNGFILDGFPRTPIQAEALKAVLDSRNEAIDKVIFLDTQDEVIVERLASRRSCKCGAIFNLKSKPPKTENVCDSCSGSLFVRADDKPETIKVRQEQYRRDTKPLIAYYTEAGLLIQILGDDSQEQVTSKILKLI